MANTTGKRFAGRAKGTPNKTTATIKEAILWSFEKVGAGQYLLKVAQDDPKTYCTLLAKILPAEVAATITGQDGGPVAIKIKWED